MPGSNAGSPLLPLVSPPGGPRPGDTSGSGIFSHLDEQPQIVHSSSSFSRGDVWRPRGLAAFIRPEIVGRPSGARDTGKVGRDRRQWGAGVDGRGGFPEVKIPGRSIDELGVGPEQVVVRSGVDGGVHEVGARVPEADGVPDRGAARPKRSADARGARVAVRGAIEDAGAAGAAADVDADDVGPGNTVGNQVVRPSKQGEASPDPGGPVMVRPQAAHL